MRVTLLFLILINLACDRSDGFLRKQPLPPPAPQQQQPPPQPEQRQPDPQPQPQAETPPPPPVPPAPVEKPCVDKIVNVLVIDLKSGWWEGDGGATFQTVQKNIDAKCQKVVFEYGHITTIEDGEGSTAQFPSLPFAQYAEIWVLSGALGDSEDLRLESETFQRLLNGIVHSKANLFLGAGFGTDYHINAITTKLGLGNLVTAGSSNDLVFLGGNGSDNIKTLTTINHLPAKDPLFRNVTSLPDQMNVNGTVMVADILALSSKLSGIISSPSGSAEIGRINLPNHKIIIDTDLARLFDILNGNQDVLNYMVNIVTVLGQ